MLRLWMFIGIEIWYGCCNQHKGYQRVGYKRVGYERVGYTRGGCKRVGRIKTVGYVKSPT